MSYLNDNPFIISSRKSFYYHRRMELSNSDIFKITSIMIYLTSCVSSPSNQALCSSQRLLALWTTIIKNHISSLGCTSTWVPQSSLSSLGPGRPSAGGPRMDRRVVTSLGVIYVSCLASRLRRSARWKTNLVPWKTMKNHKNPTWNNEKPWKTVKNHEKQ